MNVEELYVYVDCLNCDFKMEMYLYVGLGVVVMDFCVLCDLVWVDGGEII